jgi:hypothetical protein
VGIKEMLVELEQHLAAEHKKFSIAAQQVDAQQASAGDEFGDIPSEAMAGLTVDEIMLHPKFKKLWQVMRQAREEEAKRFVHIADEQDPRQTRILLLDHAIRHDPRGKTGWKPGFDPRVHVMELGEG